MNKKTQRLKRKKRIRKNVSGTTERPRVSVFKSNKYLYAQVIDDEKGVTLMSESSVKGKPANISEAANLGEKFAKEALKKKIKKVVFDRNGYAYHGRVKAFADAARKGGLIF